MFRNQHVLIMTVQAERNRSQRHARRAKGMCGRLGCKRLSGSDYYCEACSADHAAGEKRRRAKAKSA